LDQERRNFPRITTDYAVRVRVGNGTVVYEGPCLNLGPEGLMIRLSRRLREGTRTTVELDLRPLGKTITVKAKVCWSLPRSSGTYASSAMGLRFTRLTSREKNLLAMALVRQRIQGSDRE
jgi:hypothetical protein